MLFKKYDIFSTGLVEGSLDIYAVTGIILYCINLCRAGWCGEDQSQSEKALIPWFVFLMLYNTTVEDMDYTPDSLQMRLQIKMRTKQLQREGKYRCGATLLNRNSMMMVVSHKN